MPNRTFSNVLRASTSVVMAESGTPRRTSSSLKTRASGLSNTCSVIGPARPDASTRGAHPAA